MIQNIKINMELMESMLYYWRSTSDREKVGEVFIVSITGHENMKPVYTEEFSEESIRKVLSAITNREPFKGDTKLESRFWNNNMWMLEDMDYTMSIVQPLKTLNLDHLKDEIQVEEDVDVEIVIVPGHKEVLYMDKEQKKIYINFFRLMVNPWEEQADVMIDQKEVGEYIAEKVAELVQ